MIDLDYGPIAVGITIALAFVAPVLYGVFVDNYDKRSPQIRSKHQ